MKMAEDSSDQYLMEAIKTIRNEAIEECVQAAQQWLIRAEQGSGEDLIDAICALKDKL